MCFNFHIKFFVFINVGNSKHGLSCSTRTAQREVNHIHTSNFWRQNQLLQCVTQCQSVTSMVGVMLFTDTWSQ